MKKILFATTALVATAGAAAADVSIKGRAEIGIVGGDAYATDQFHTDIDIDFDMSGEADNGLTFGASVDLDEAASGFPATDDNGVSYFVAFGGARLDMGDVDGAFDAALTETLIGDSLADDHEVFGGYEGNSGMDGTYDGQIATFSYAFSGFTGYVSTEIDDTGTFDPVWAVGFKYAVDVASASVGVGIGYQSGDGSLADVTGAAASTAITAAIAGGASAGIDDDAELAAAFVLAGTAAREDIWGISLDTTFDNGVVAILNYSESNYSGITGTNTETESFWGLALGYSMNAVTVGVNYGKFDDRYGFDGLETEGYGLAVDYDMGGGLVAQFGYGNSKVTGGGQSFDSDSYSLGLAMSF